MKQKTILDVAPKHCVHYEVDFHEGTKSMIRTDCTSPVEAGRPNGFLCAMHQHMMDTDPKTRYRTPSADVLLLTHMQGEVDRSRRDGSGLDLTNIPALRRGWVQKAA